MTHRTTRERGGAVTDHEPPCAPNPVPPDAITYQGESKSQPLQRRCPIDARPVVVGFGRPRVYCSTECRREAYRRRNELDDLEAQLADARDKLASGFAPGTHFWQGMAALYERQVAELRPLIPEALR